MNVLTLPLPLPVPSLPIALPGWFTAWIAKLIRDLMVKILSGVALELLKPTLAPIGERIKAGLRRLKGWLTQRG